MNRIFTDKITIYIHICLHHLSWHKSSIDCFFCIRSFLSCSSLHILPFYSTLILYILYKIKTSCFENCFHYSVTLSDVNNESKSESKIYFAQYKQFVLKHNENNSKFRVSWTRTFVLIHKSNCPFNTFNHTTKTHYTHK